jgi:hypothetical protein
MRMIAARTGIDNPSLPASHSNRSQQRRSASRPASWRSLDFADVRLVVTIDHAATAPTAAATTPPKPDE